MSRCCPPPLAPGQVQTRVWERRHAVRLAVRVKHLETVLHRQSRLASARGVLRQQGWALKKAIAPSPMNLSTRPPASADRTLSRTSK